MIFSSSRLVHVDVGMSFLISMFPEENNIKVCPSMCFRFLAFFDGVGFIFPSYRNQNTLQHKPDVIVSLAERDSTLSNLKSESIEN